MKNEQAKRGWSGACDGCDGWPAMRHRRALQCGGTLDSLDTIYDFEGVKV